MEDKYFTKFCDIIESNNLFDDVDSFLILFSCGKDCTMMLDLFLRYQELRGLSLPYSVYSVPYPKHMYFDSQRNRLSNYQIIIDYWEQRGVTINTVVSDSGDFADEDRNGCNICKNTRKDIIDCEVRNNDANTGIMTGFTLNDALSYLNMILLYCNFDLSKLESLSQENKYSVDRMLHKMSLKEKLPSKKIMLRPLLPFNEQEVIDYLQCYQIPFLDKPCKISQYKFKRLYTNALDVFNPTGVTYQGIEKFLKGNGIELNNGGLSSTLGELEKVEYFIDC